MVPIAYVYNRYLNRGGEDEVFEAEYRLMSKHGHKVYAISTQTIVSADFVQKARMAAGTIWSNGWYFRFKKLIRKHGIKIVHVHNFFPVMSPAIFYAAKEAGAAVVMTLHNYRLLCPRPTLYRNFHTCEKCLGKLPWRSIWFGCYQNSRSKTAVIATMLTLHRWLRTWDKQVDLYIALTKFERQKFIEAGFPAEKIVIKPNFVEPDPVSILPNVVSKGKYALFVGRLSLEKGVLTMMRAWSRLKGIPIKIVGDGPLMEEIQSFIEREGLREVKVLGRLDREEVFRLMRGARFLVFPSEWYETFGMTIAEAFACGVPVVASKLGVMAEIVEDERTGLHFAPGDSEDLAAKVEWAWRNPEKMFQMGKEARDEYEAKYTAGKNFQILMSIYESVIP